ncbi:MAG: lamin tail domain-containing protein [Methanothrix sp.]|jgi:hypothetical protein
MKFVTGKALLAILGVFAFAAFCGCCLGDVVVNEVELAPPNNGTIWVELYNTGENAVDLNGWTVKVENEPWVGPIALSGSIEPKGFFVAEGKPSWVTNGNGTVYLLDAQGTVLDKTPEINDDRQNDFSYGRLPDGKNTNTKADFLYMKASKGQPNRLY